MVAKSTLREDETFVIEAVAKAFGGSWSPGEDPPDAYLTMGEESVAVEISTLTQHVIDGRGTRPRLSDDQTSVAFANDLNAELGHLIPYGHTIGLILRSPIANRRKTQAALSKKLREFIAEIATFPSDQPIALYGNTITPYLNHHGAPDYKKISAIITHQSSSSDILENTKYVLADRIRDKAKKCVGIRGQVWLALLNDYFLTDFHTYKYALSFLTLAHPFEKIILIGGDGKAEILSEANPTPTPPCKR
jgi:hypothetical protein